MASLNILRSGSVAIVLVIELLAVAVSAAPAPRGDPTAIPGGRIEDFTSEAIASYLESQHATGLPFNVNGPWSTINFAGNTTTQTSFMMNNDIYRSVDEQNDRRTNSTINFSRMYGDFINQKIPHPPVEESQKLNETHAQMNKACFGGALETALTSALIAYNKWSHVKTTNDSDPKFLAFANTDFPDYITAHTACTQATLAFDAATSEVEGDDAGLYAGAIGAPGVNMPIADDQSTGTIDQGQYVAYYSIPTLNATLTGWQGGVGLQPFKYASKEANGSTSSSSKFGGGKLGITYEGVTVGAHADHSESKNSATAMAKDFELSFGALALLSIDQGLWFDGYRLARAAQNPDAKHGPAKDVFSNESYFGSADAPGPLAVYNNMALVGYKPSWKIQLQDSSAMDSSSTTSAGVDISVFGLFSIGGYGGSTKNNTQYDKSTNTVTIEDDSSNGYIIGYVQKTFFS
ncbi:hypothetical protein B0H15DRAFT_944797 [Mycena belliarum]|uniref:Uncharacterized protein n=1 Tax=Mycena belliarum TaxID=1033014 RepID=A0AAD6UHV1_9AGAR|nr:hypothetical protein B0H15DRAFT_944797 [Mycena belliae]